MFIKLLPEIQEHILSYLIRLKDVWNLSQTSWEYYEALRSHLFSNITLSTSVIQRPDFDLNNHLHLLQYTRTLLIVTEQVPHHVLRCIGKLHQLHELRFRFGAMDEQPFHDMCEDLSDAADLKILQINEIVGINHLLRDIAKLNSLQKLDLAYCKDLRDDSLMQLVSLDNLQDLGLLGCIEVKGWALCSENFPNLRTLDIGYCSGITSEGFVSISTLRQVELLNACCISGINSAVCLEITKMSGLKKLDLSFNRTNSIEIIATMSSLEVLILQNFHPFTERLLHHLSTMNALKYLDLRHTGIKQRHLAGLVKRYPRLQQVNVWCCHDRCRRCNSLCVPKLFNELILN